MPSASATEHLPASLRELVPVIGLPAVLVLIKRWGGTRFYVPTPERLGRGHPLARAIGQQPAQALAQYCRGSAIDIPIAARHARRLRLLEIAERTSRGESAAAIARALGITERWVVMQRRRHRLEQGADNQDQGELF